MSDVALAELSEQVQTPVESKPKQQLLPQKQQNGAVIFFDEARKPLYGFERGDLDISLPSGKRVNIFYDSRLQAQAAYSPDTTSFTFTPATIGELQHPENYPQEGWQTPSQRTEYILKHEYNHFAWDQLDQATREQVISLFYQPGIAKATRLFAADLITKSTYRVQEELDPNVDCLEFTINGRVYRYSKELIINELLAHATIGEMMDRQAITVIQRNNPQRENFGLRSKSALDCLTFLKKNFPQGYEALIKNKLINNPDFKSDLPVIKTKAVSLAA